MAIIFGPTAGYLVGFIPAAILVGYLSEKGFSRNRISMFFTLLLGLTVIYLFGVFRLLSFVEYEKVFILGITPFLVGDAIKTVMATILIPSGWKLIKREK